jgi:hypothetical protein
MPSPITGPPAIGQHLPVCRQPDAGVGHPMRQLPGLDLERADLELVADGKLDQCERTLQRPRLVQVEDPVHRARQGVHGQRRRGLLPEHPCP